MKAVELLIAVTQDAELAVNSWVESIWSERELRFFESNAIRKFGGVKLNNDYLCSYSEIKEFPVDAIYSIPQFDVLVYCYRIS